MDPHLIVEAGAGTSGSGTPLSPGLILQHTPLGPGANFAALVLLKSMLDDVDAADDGGIGAAVASAVAADGTGAVAQFVAARGGQH